MCDKHNGVSLDIKAGDRRKQTRNCEKVNTYFIYLFALNNSTLLCELCATTGDATLTFFWVAITQSNVLSTVLFVWPIVGRLLSSILFFRRWVTFTLFCYLLAIECKCNFYCTHISRSVQKEYAFDARAWARAHTYVRPCSCDWHFVIG